MGRNEEDRHIVEGALLRHFRAQEIRIENEKQDSSIPEGGQRPQPMDSQPATAVESRAEWCPPADEPASAKLQTGRSQSGSRRGLSLPADEDIFADEPHEEQEDHPTLVDDSDDEDEIP